MEPSKKGRGIGLVLLVVGALLVVALVNRSGNTPVAAAPAAAPTTVAKAEPAAVIPAKAPEVAPTPSAPGHYYSMEDEGEYGYEGALSENDKNAGKAVKPVIMVRYLGQKNGAYTAQIQDGQGMQRLSCKAPCDFIKISYIYAGQVIKTETVRTTGNSVMDAVFHDAQNDLLTPYRSRQ